MKKFGFVIENSLPLIGLQPPVMPQATRNQYVFLFKRTGCHNCSVIVVAVLAIMMFAMAFPPLVIAFMTFFSFMAAVIFPLSVYIDNAWLNVNRFRLHINGLRLYIDAKDTDINSDIDAGGLGRGD
jgi:hypothetical protein